MKKIAQINVGLNVGEKQDALSGNAVERTLRKVGLVVHRRRIARSKTENTVCAVIRGKGVKEIKAALHKAALELQQDCIAVAWGNGTGALVGPEAAKWGKFDKAYFLPAVQKIS